MHQLPKEIENPAGEGKLVLKKELAVMKYRGETFKYTHYYYLWEENGERFTTTESDGLSISQVYDEYRRRHNIPFPEEICELRKKCGLSAAKMSLMLGIGINQYRLYEAGEVPSLSTGKMLYVLCHNNEALMQYALLEKTKLGEKNYNKILSTLG